MGNDAAFISRMAKANKRISKTHERSTERWADKLVAKQAARARATRSCPTCDRGVRKDARFCEHCGEELAA
jgi:hypothetical protein